MVIIVLTLKFNDMESNNLGSKKTNNKQNSDTESVDKNLNPETSILKEEIEIDSHGNEKVVQRVRDIDKTTPLTILNENEKKWNKNKNLSRGVSTEADVKKTVENRDRNSDITPNRYPNSNPDNHIDRGNQKLNE
jgi:hypothetical protein